ncbi:uncharacterized protein N7500_007261 [Penicillium coprophilum]|uniref:uncharacterized protein n=1 Tax=Penicillium coprophilum TaxID=36646 RepID=UPI0023917EB1|nr:uncharacterized protein N7500_007261 [Penicillium coprophilum]KAJ5165431.1 hypothetical protein N7500_007261 [Penicillium coprophilum]
MLVNASFSIYLHSKMTLISPQTPISNCPKTSPQCHNPRIKTNNISPPPLRLKRLNRSRNPLPPKQSSKRRILRRPPRMKRLRMRPEHLPKPSNLRSSKTNRISNLFSVQRKQLRHSNSSANRSRR